MDEEEGYLADFYLTNEYETWHDGPGWYYVDHDYRDEGSVGAFATLEEAQEHARKAGYYWKTPKVMDPPCTMCNGLGFKAYDGLATPCDCPTSIPYDVRLGKPVPSGYKLKVK